MSSLKDRLDEERVRADAWRPEAGDELIGKVVRYNMRKMDDGDDYPVVTVERDSGDKWAFHAFHKVARSQMEEEGNPQAGDEIAIRYLGKVDGGQYSYHNYRVVVERLVPPAATAPAAASASESDFAPAPTQSNDDASIPF